MKEDKICLSKTVAFVAVVAFILVGVVVFTNYVNTQKLGTESKAAGAVGQLIPLLRDPADPNSGTDRLIACPTGATVATALRQGAQPAHSH